MSYPDNVGIAFFYPVSFGKYHRYGILAVRLKAYI